MRYSKYLLIAWSMTFVTGMYEMLVNFGALPTVPDVYNPGFIIMFAFLIQNAILGGTIVVQSEMSIIDERLRRTDAEHQVKDAREKLIQADRMSGLASMVSSVSHEIATPVGNARLLGSEIESRSGNLGDSFSREELSNEEFEDFLDFTRESGALIVQTLSHAGSIMEGFKVVAADQATLKQKSIDPREYFRRLEKVFSPGIRKSGHELSVLVETEKPIQTIPGYVTQVMDNLVNNAVRHAFPKGVKGHIRIEVRNTGQGNKLEITVSDDGSGIPEDVLPHIFEMFYTTREGEGGTGLGLAISKTLAEEHLRGSLKCFTEKDRGTRFVFGIADLTDSPA
jgi:signal transduction histidine kinase